EVTFDAITVAKEEAAESGTRRTLKRAWAKLKGSRALVTVDACGVPKSAKLKLKAKPPEELAEPIQTLAQAIRDLQTRFPTEPVGLGARWSVTEPVFAAGQSYSRTTTWTLVATAKDSVTVSVTRDETAPAGQAMTGLPEGMTATITRVGGRGTGKTLVNQRWLIPVTHQYDSVYEMDIAVKNGRKPFDMRTRADHSSQVIRLEPEK
ncbi:MAG: hypothetical protein ACI9OJ_004895, partial [Myxococcota bacterium]